MAAATPKSHLEMPNQGSGVQIVAWLWLRVRCPAGGGHWGAVGKGGTAPTRSLLRCSHCSSAPSPLHFWRGGDTVHSPGLHPCMGSAPCCACPRAGGCQAVAALAVHHPNPIICCLAPNSSRNHGGSPNEDEFGQGRWLRAGPRCVQGTVRVLGAASTSTRAQLCLFSIHPSPFLSFHFPSSHREIRTKGALQRQKALSAYF